MLKAHRAIESICLDREVAHLKDDLMPRYAFAHLQRLLVEPGAQDAPGDDRRFSGERERRVRLKLYKGNAMVVGRESGSDSLFDTALATFEEDRGAYNQADAAGFIRLSALRMRTAGKAAQEAAALSSYSNLLVSVPTPSITMLTVLPGVIAPRPPSCRRRSRRPARGSCPRDEAHQLSGEKTMSKADSAGAPGRRGWFFTTSLPGSTSVSIEGPNTRRCRSSSRASIARTQGPSR